MKAEHCRRVAKLNRRNIVYKAIKAAVADGRAATSVDIGTDHLTELAALLEPDGFTVEIGRGNIIIRW